MKAINFTNYLKTLMCFTISTFIFHRLAVLPTKWFEILEQYIHMPSDLYPNDVCTSTRSPSVQKLCHHIAR